MRIPQILLVATALCGNAFVTTSLQAQNTTKNELQQRSLQVVITEAAQKFSLPERWIIEVIRAESAGRVRATSHKGAMGLMQIMPGTWKYLRRKYGLGSNAYDVRDNVMAGSAYLRELHDRFGFPGCLAAYNAGPARYRAWAEGKKRLPLETRLYVRKITSRLGQGTSFVRTSGQSESTASRSKLAASPLFVTRSGVQNPQIKSDSRDGEVSDPEDGDLRRGGLFVPASKGQRP